MGFLPAFWISGYTNQGLDWNYIEDGTTRLLVQGFQGTMGHAKVRTRRDTLTRPVSANMCDQARLCTKIHTPMVVVTKTLMDHTDRQGKTRQPESKIFAWKGGHPNRSHP